MIGSGLLIAADGRGARRALADCWWGQSRMLGWGDSAAGGNRTEAANGLGTVLAHPGRGRSVRGRTLEWIGPGERRAWELPVVVAARGVAGDAVWATLEGAPIVARRQLRGLPAIVCGLDPADVPAAPELGAILRLALLASRPAAAWLDLDGIVALRMDDPGASASVHLDPWNYEKLDPEEWEEIGRLLARSDAVLTIGYTPGWVDDGDAERGELRVGGRRVKRRPGDVHPSPLVDYRGRRAPSADCQAEFRAVADLRSRGLCTVEMHGYTHVHPELERWARAPTRHQKLGWYRELGPEVAGTLRRKAGGADPIARGLELFERHFGESPAVLVCPGNACGPESLERAFALGLEAVAADGLAVRRGGDLEWLPGVRNAEPELHGSRSLGALIPAVACFHDRDLAEGGVDWLHRLLARWRSAGAETFMDLRELTSALGLGLALDRDPDGWRLEVARERGPALRRSFPVLVRAPDRLPAALPAVTPQGTLRLDVDPVADGVWRVLLPAGI
jgi:hypothetical protein